MKAWVQNSENRTEIKAWHWGVLHMEVGAVNETSQRRYVGKEENIRGGGGVQPKASH